MFECAVGHMGWILNFVFGKLHCYVNQMMMWRLHLGEKSAATSFYGCVLRDRRKWL